MAFWNRKKKTESEEQIQALFASNAFQELTKAINRSTDSQREATEKSMRSFQEMTRALNNATKEFKKGLK